MKGFRILLPMLCVAACSQAPDSSVAPPAGPASTSQPSPAPSAPDEDHLSPVVAEVNGRPLYQAFYEQSLSYIRNRLESRQDPGNVERYLNARFDALERIIDDELIYQEAIRIGMAVPEAEVQQEFARAANGAGGEARFLAMMRAQGISRNEAVEGTRKRLTVDRFIHERLTSGLTVTEDEVVAYYNENIGRFTPEAWVKLFEISVLCPSDAPADTVARARQRAEKILAEIRTGKSFESIARDYSEDRQALNGGNLGFVKRGATYPEFDAVAFAMRPGDVSDLIRTKDGFHIIKVAERRGGEPVPFEKAKDDCRKALMSRRQADAVGALVSRLRQTATITSHLK